MSKSKGNVVNPDNIIVSHGADTLRLYEMFMGPLDADVAWSTNGLDGARRFLDRIWRLIIQDDGSPSDKIVSNMTESSLDKVYHETVKKVTTDFENLSFNTGISQLMVFVNEGNKTDQLSKEHIEGLIKLLSPVAPHLAEEIWHRLGHEESISYASWPVYDESKLIEDQAEIVIQIMGKVRAKIMVPADSTKEDLEKMALANETIQEKLVGKTIQKVITVPGKLVNIVAN